MKTAHRLCGSTLFWALLAFGCGSDHEAERTPDAPEEPESPFAAPPPGTERVELTFDSFELGPGSEIYKCQNFENPFGRDVAIIQSQSIMTSGSHHLAVFRFDENADGELEDCDGLEFHQTLHAAQTLTARTTYPQDVGAFLRGVDGIRLNAHYLNTSEETIRPEITVVFDIVDAADVEHKAAQIYLNDSTIDVPPGRGTAGGTLNLPPEVGEIRLISAQSHMHRRAIGFHSEMEDGTVLYETNSWSEPPVKVFLPEVVLAPESAISWSCEYENETATNLKFGESADTDEMCVFTGFYYPAPEGMTLVGDLILGQMGLTR